MYKIKSYIIVTFYFLLILSCSKSVEILKEEIYKESDRPEFVQDQQNDFYLCKPWNYDKSNNSEREYPLFVYLHGGGGDGKPSCLPCFLNDDDKKKYPCFVYLPHSVRGWNQQKYIDQIESLKSQYRINKNRIYLMGYSMGGSGSYAHANRYYDYNKHLYAGIVRMAGQSQTIVREAIAEKTSIWYHVGLSDTPKRVEVANAAYKFLKEFPSNQSATEITIYSPNNEYPSVTTTLKLNDIEIVKFTKYNAPVGHNVSHIPLIDPYLLEWLFNQSLDK